MSIDKTQRMQPTSPIHAREQNDVAAAKNRQPAAGTNSEPTASQVVLSGAQSQLTHSNSSDINQARVEQLKNAIRNGELKMDTGKIADALIQQARDAIEGK